MNLLKESSVRTNERFVIQRGSFEGSPVKDDVYVSLSGSMQTSNTQENLDFLKGIIDEIKKTQDELFVIDMADGRVKDIITTSHKKMKTYMDNIIFSFSYYYFLKAQEKVRQRIDVIFNPQEENSEANKLPRRAALVSSTYISKRLYSNLVTFLQSVFDEFLEKQQLGRDVISDYVKSIGNRESYSSAFYYYVRAKMIEKVGKAAKGACGDTFKSIKALEGNEVAMYINKMMVDLFIKTSGPLVQYIYIASLLKRYMYKGDFVNSRLGLLTQITYITYLSNTMSSVLTNWKNVTSSSNVNYSTLDDLQARVDDITFKLNLYIQNMNRINISSTSSTSEGELKKIVEDLHKMSNDVSNQATDISQIKKTIQESRLAMRNILYNTEMIKEKRKKKLIEFYVVLSLLIIVSITCSVLLILKMANIVFYVAGATVAGVLIYKLILMIMDFVRKN
jgi:hypothetical protein